MMYGQENIKFLLEFPICLCVCIFQTFLLSVVFRRVRKIAENDYQLRHVCLSVRM